MVMLKYLSTILIAALATTAAHAQAGPGPGRVQSESVFYNDLDLTKSAGVAVLDRRIKSAARRICGWRYHAADLIERALQRTCLNATTAATAPQRDAAIAMARGGQAGTQLARVIE